MKATKFKAQLVKFATSPLIAPVVFPGVEVKSKTDKDVLIAIKATLAKLATPISEEPAEDERFCLTAGDQPKMASVAKPEEDLGPKPDSTIELRFEIVKYIIEVKLAERKARRQQKAKAERRQHIREILATKNEEELRNKSVAELEAELESLNDD